MVLYTTATTLVILASASSLAAASAHGPADHRQIARRFKHETRRITVNVVAANVSLDKRQDASTIFAQIAQVAKLAVAEPIQIPDAQAQANADAAAAAAEAQRVKDEAEAKAAADAAAAAAAKKAADEA